MAARTGKTSNSKNTSKTTEAPAEVDNTTTAQEGTVSTETPETTAPAEASTTTPAAKAPEPDLSAFIASVTAAQENADVTTGDVPEADMSAVTLEYRKLEGIKAKNKAKDHVNELMKSAMNDGDLAKARSFLNLSETALVAAAGGSSTPKPPADPTDAFVQRVVTLNLAYNLAVGATVEGVDSAAAMEKANAQVQELNEIANGYAAWLASPEEGRDPEPEAPSFVKSAAKLAAGKAAKAGATSGSRSTFTGERRDVAVHIKNAFADKESGTFLKVAEIVGIASDEYGTDKPSPGAVSARLFPVDKEKNPKESALVADGIIPEVVDGNKGARKA